VHVRRDCAANAQSIGARLLLPDPPLLLGPCLLIDEPRDQLGPLDPGLDLDQPTLTIEPPDALIGTRIEKNRPAGELLATHGVAASARADRFACRASIEDGVARVGGGPNHGHTVDDGGVELGVDVVHHDAQVSGLSGARLNGWYGAIHRQNDVVCPGGRPIRGLT